LCKKKQQEEGEEEKENNLTDGRSLSTYQSINSLALFD
jgi:hypothetical protein